MNIDGLRLAFAGTPELASIILSTIVRHNGHDLRLIITQPDRPAGRGRTLMASPVKRVAEQHGLPVRQPFKPADIDPDKTLAEVDVLVVAAFGMILPDEILYRPRLGCINVHLSLLPRWRGAAPIQRAIQAGDVRTGVTVMQIDEGLDTGDILLQRECPIKPEDTAGSLFDELAILGGECLLEALADLADNNIAPRKQDDRLATYAHKVTKEDALIDWNLEAEQLERMIRAFNPVPVAHTQLQNTMLRIWEADVLSPDKIHTKPGEIIAIDNEGIVVATSRDALRIRRLQLPGRKVTGVRDFLNGHPDLLKTG